MIKLVTGDVTDSVGRDYKDSLEVEVDRIVDGIELDDDGLEVVEAEDVEAEDVEAEDVEAEDVKAEDVEAEGVEVEGFSMVAEPSSKRPDGVLQHSLFSKFDSQQ